MQLMSWLFGPRGSVPEDQIVYAIGDIHGRDDLLGRLHEVIQQELVTTADGRNVQVVYLGDYVDRGPDSRAVVDRLLERPLQGVQAVFLKGNHEDTMLRFLNGKVGSDTWLNLGGGATAKSYGISLRSQRNEPLPIEAVRDSLNAALPERHLSFFRSLKLYHEVGDYLFVHAGIRPGRTIEEQSQADLLWIRGEFLRSRRQHERIVVHGHAAHHDAVIRRNRICVDTMAYATDRLSCVVLEGTSYRFLCVEI